MDTSLRTLIAGAQNVCLEKIDLFKRSSGANASAATAVEKRMERLFDALSDPGIWGEPPLINHDPINQNIVELEKLGSDRTAEIPGQITRLLDLIEQSILQSDLESTRGPNNTPPTNDMNLQVMNALARTRQQIGIRLVKFAQEGEDLQQDPEFQTMQSQQETLVSSYWEKLKTNAITGRETDVNHIRQRGEFIASSAVVGTFKVHYKLLSEFIRSKLTPIAVLFILYFSYSAASQSLLDDGRNFLKAVETIQDTNHSWSARDSAARQALLILYLYDNPAQAEKPGQVQTDRLLDHVQGNGLFRELLPARYLDTLRRKVPPVPTSAEWDSLQTQGRRQIGALMYGGAPLSPVQYLSVQQSLQNSQLPPLQTTAAMRSAAENLQKPGSVSGLRAEVLLEGLFNFILERAQQEVTINFLDRLLNEKIPRIGWLFPNVRERYSNPEISYSQSFLESLREAFFLDLSRLNLTLPELLLKDEYFGELQRDPVFYNLLTVYTIFGLAKSDVPLWEAVPLTHRNLYENFEAAGQKLNIRLADSAFTTLEYRQMQDSAQAYVDQMQRVVAAILDIQQNCESRINRLLEQFSGDTLPVRPVFPENPLYDYRVLTGRSDPKAVFHLGLLPQLLQGAIDDTTLKQYNTLPSYDKFFAIPYSGREMRIAGLELARRLTDGTWYNELTQVDILKRWQADLAIYVGDIDRWQMSFDTLNLSGQYQETDSRRRMLAGAIAQSSQYWQTSGDPADLQALVLLGAIAADFDDIIPFDLSYQDSVRMLGERQEKLFQLEKRLAAAEHRLSANNKAAAAQSPFQQYLRRAVAVRPVDTLTGQIEKLGELSAKIRNALRQLDSSRAQKEQKAWSVSGPVLQVTELLSHLFYVLQRPDGKGLMSLKELDEMLYEPRLKTACLGLLQQRISRIKNVGILSPEALAQFTRLTLQDFLELQTPKDSLSGEKPDSLRLYKTISTGLRAFNRILEFPLFADPAKPGEFKSLTKRYPVLQHLPDISERCMNFLYYLETRQYRPAVSALVRLVTSLSKQIELVETQQKLKKEKSQPSPLAAAGKPRKEIAPSGASANQNYLLRFFEQYGDFIAGLVDARDKNEVEYLLKSLADPPGSSRTKRTHRFTASLNAYLGASAGWEYWARKQNNITENTNFGMLAPAIPVGFTLSRLLWAQEEHPQSFSLHVTVLDLGGMMTYRLAEEDKYGAYKLSFKNVFKPGLQLHWNIQKSPFYLGLGWQTGPQFRQENGEEVAFRASRFFISFGVDTPIRTLYAR